MTAQDVINDAVNDARQVIGSTSAGQAVLLDYVDRIQKDCLHSSIYKFLNVAVTSFETVAGQPSYQLATSGIRRLTSVYDRELDRMLFPLSLSMSPAAIGAAQVQTPGQTPQPPRPLARIRTTTSALSEYYQLVGTNTLYLYPTPAAAWQGEATYEMTVQTLSSATATLTIPDDAKDMMVNGVNMLVALYLKLDQNAQMWSALFMQAKSGASFS